MINLKFKIYFLLLISIFNISNAAQVDYFAGGSVTQYDNIELEFIPREETAVSLNTGIKVFEDSANLSSNVRFAFSSIDYLNDVTEDENIGKLFANFVWRVSPGQFEWHLDEVFTQTVIDVLESDAPSNRQNINFISTGPDYTIRANARNNIIFKGRVQKYNFEKDKDNSRARLDSVWLHKVNSSLSLSVNSNAELARFENNDVNTDFTRFDGFLSLDYDRGLNKIELEYGTSHIGKRGEDDFDSNRYLVSIINKRTKTSQVAFTYISKLSDTGRQAANLGYIENIGDTVLDSVANTVFVDETIQMQYLKTYSSGKVTFELRSRQRDYVIQDDLDDEAVSAVIKGVEFLHGANSVGYGINYTNKIFQDPVLAREDDNFTYSLNYSHYVRRNIRFRIDIRSLERESTVSSEAYDDLRITASLVYTSL
ncbi:MAG: hypothetical protein DIZ80_06375 [endosymbiont of Galathealinum brachiosum]|uniref:TIGR03016 family PEP-CTERM system-associated outer membrane protein n=1 Tax=endosymbiont of Galathealinum brachiosum TaxID=2200906 RepID=A0A370DFR7_9GAMM|nr:MAG: hypothetical protein DIZ80_06375 [endosymbiont of Galathealinum brachiosum]